MELFTFYEILNESLKLLLEYKDNPQTFGEMIANNYEKIADLRNAICNAFRFIESSPKGAIGLMGSGSETILNNKGKSETKINKFDIRGEDSRDRAEKIYISLRKGSNNFQEKVRPIYYQNPNSSEKDLIRNNPSIIQIVDNIQTLVDTYFRINQEQNWVPPANMPKNIIKLPDSPGLKAIRNLELKGIRNRKLI